MELEERNAQSTPFFGASPGNGTNHNSEEEGFFSALLRSKESSTTSDEDPATWRLLALLVSLVSIFVILFLGIAAIVCSEVSNSSAELAFAFDALLGLFSSGSVVWRFYKRLTPSEVPKKEKTACFIIAVGFLLSAVMMFTRAIYCLVNHVEPTKTVAIIVISTLGFLCYSLLFYAKFKVAQKLHSVTMRTDSLDSACGAVMSLGVLLSTIISQHTLDTWWLDPVIAMMIAMVTFTYGICIVIKVILREGFGEPEEYEQFY